MTCKMYLSTALIAAELPALLFERRAEHARYAACEIAAVPKLYH
jgi:hypothetical protein